MPTQLQNSTTVMNAAPKEQSESGRNLIYKKLKNAKLLLVDDDSMSLEQLEIVLHSHGHENLAMTTDPRQVIQLIEEIRPDLILLDLHMPNMDGFQVLTEIRNKKDKNEFLPIIMLTAEDTIEAKSKALNLGAMDFLSKPYAAQEVLLRTNNLLRIRQLQLLLQHHNQNLDRLVSQRTNELEDALNEVKAIQDKLVAQERMKAMGEMASGIAHDFNNSIAAIMGNVELLITFPELRKNEQKCLKSLNTIHLASKDASSIVNRLKEFYKSGINEDEESIVDLKYACKDVVVLTKSKWDVQARVNGSKICVKTELKSVNVAVIPSKVREMLTNLIFNAVDAMPKGGDLILRCFKENNFGVLEVQDTGVGMSDEIQKKCREIFYTTKGKNGTGLGLYSINRMIERYNGELEIQSEQGKGTCLRIRLPLAKIESTLKSPVTFKLDKNLRILLIEDDAQVLNTMKTNLEMEGHTIQAVTDGRNGLVEFFKNTYDLVITEQAVPEVSGKQLARTIRAHSKDIPIIMLDGFNHTIDNSEDVNIILQKPVEMSGFRRVIFDLFNKN